MILSMTNKTKYTLDAEEAEAVLNAIQNGDKFVILQGDYIMLAAVIAIQDEERFEEAEHIRNGDYKCAFNKWHSKHDKCFGHEIHSNGLTTGYLQLKSDNRTDEQINEAARAKWEEMRDKFAKSKSIR